MLGKCQDTQGHQTVQGLLKDWVHFRRGCAFEVSGLQHFKNVFQQKSCSNSPLKSAGLDPSTYPKWSGTKMQNEKFASLRGTQIHPNS